MLVDVVAKGGNLLLNIAPSPEGEWQQGAYNLLNEFSSWIKINGEGIYNSKVLPPFKERNICMTQQDNGNAYFFYLANQDENTMPAEIIIKSHQPTKKAKVYLLGYAKPLKWKKLNEGFKVFIPEAIRNKPKSKYVWTIKVSEIK
jgi:alpha-L-fucosidase